MKELLGSPGTVSGLTLRIGQCLFAGASIGVMVSALGFSSYTAFCYAILKFYVKFISYLIASMGLQVLWSFGLACLDVYALRIKRDLHNPVLVSLFVVGDWVTATFMNSLILLNTSHGSEKAEEAKSSGDSLAQLGKGAALMVCRSCGMKGDHWTARCHYPGLAHQTQLLTPPSTEAAAAASSSTQDTSYVPPRRREGAERSVIGSDMRRRNDDYAIRIDNLSEDTQDSDLIDLCHPFGQVLRAHVPKDYATRSGRGYGYVNFLRREDAERAINKLDGYGYDNLILRVEWSAPRTN
ncbi:hypothetical protein RHSIM_Rhsim05G0196200 [Rhododendron simsii]|uniref:CASP-like protein n=1 Tax=Rhododendron simsii TaxID=118357 RepID=A0A834LN05_RHOSS|nr:hypothetical protein RHSIM_Rhsim05G0196200 [Rhododendron simsii]